MIKVGVTGGIGSGKSTVCRVFQEMGVPVYEADVRAKAVIHYPEVQQKVIALLGEEAYKDGKLNRDYVASQVFNDMELRDALNEVIHPAVGNDYKEWLKQHESAPVVIKEAALFFETGSSLAMDVMVLVVADLDERVERILKRDPFRSKEEIMKIIASQLPDDEKLKQTDFVIHNNITDALLPQINEVLKGIITEWK